MCLWDKILVSSRVSSGVEMRVVVVLALLFWGFSHETEYGDIFDCVDINKQPALDHPLLKNHRVQKKPSVFLKGLGPKTSAKTQSSKIGFQMEGSQKGQCPSKGSRKET
ncbi:hypothetical protein CK203_091905 [Vitis vinifera]|uniref:Neprosin activation peptide domain-containing protein n=1 Tax=Vitis vinifera TaxID=29760 RepID=A0A438E2L7_VITVI|nr:hypothetical protein CK203_091905 [Vitis vinifera]